MGDDIKSIWIVFSVAIFVVIANERQTHSDKNGKKKSNRYVAMNRSAFLFVYIDWIWSIYCVLSKNILYVKLQERFIAQRTIQIWNWIFVILSCIVISHSSIPSGKKKKTQHNIPYFFPIWSPEANRNNKQNKTKGERTTTEYNGTILQCTINEMKGGMWHSHR